MPNIIDNNSWTSLTEATNNISSQIEDFADYVNVITEIPLNSDEIVSHENDNPLINDGNYTWLLPFYSSELRCWVMIDTNARHYDTGFEFISIEYEQYYYILSEITDIVHIRPNERAYRIEFGDHLDIPAEEPEYEEENNYVVNDGYSEERSDTNNSDIIPLFRTNIGREIPLISFEQEFSGHGDKVAQVLYQAGIAYSRYSDAYHMAEGRHVIPGESDRICYVETDSSCGYELIFDRVDLTDITTAEKISHAQTILRDLRDEESIRLSARCGFHIHLDVSNWGMKEIVSAYHLWNYLEDPIFRFASAFWNQHRDEEVGGGYSAPVPKGHTQRAHIANTLYDRRDALNFSHILRAKTNCNCGAYIYEDWANCTCNLRQPTLEFRVFNATMNQRKIRAYLAFCIGFVNMVKKVEHDPVNFPEMRWRGTNRRSVSWKGNCLERIDYIMNKFPLTNSEKSDIEYCFRNSSLELVYE